MLYDCIRFHKQLRSFLGSKRIIYFPSTSICRGWNLLLLLSQFYFPSTSIYRGWNLLLLLGGLNLLTGGLNCAIQTFNNHTRILYYFTL